MALQCQIDPRFKPKKGSQLQFLRNDIDDLRSKLDFLLSKECIIGQILQRDNQGRSLLQQAMSDTPPPLPQLQQQQQQLSNPDVINKVSVQTYLVGEPQLLQQQQQQQQQQEEPSHSAKLPPLLNDSVPPNASKEVLPLALKMALHKNTSSQNQINSRHNSRSVSPLNVSFPHASAPPSTTAATNNTTGLAHATNANDIQVKREHVIATTKTIPLLPSPHGNVDEFVLGNISISIDKANELHHIFVHEYLPYFPILKSYSATELYSQSQLLFWTVMLTASLSDPEPTMYIELASLIKQLAIETCWMRTPRSTQISQALLILCNWPLPNSKVLDDCSYRFVALAKSLSYQLGLHRGKFIQEFTRTQTSMPNAEKWRTRTWLGIFFAELCWASILGLPSTSQTDYLIEKAIVIDENESENDLTEDTEDDLESSDDTDADDNEDRLPKRFKRLLCLANFQSKLCGVMGSSVTSPDGLLESDKRIPAITKLESELTELNDKLNFRADNVTQIYYLYVRLMVYCFVFLPGTSMEDQSKYVMETYVCSTQIVTLLTKLLERQQLIALPIYIRQSASFASLILFKLQLYPNLLGKYLDSARQSIVTVHRLFRNQLTAWATGVENDISRTASMLEKLNMVLITHPHVFIEEPGIISRMRSHLTGSLFYDLVWCVHEARRREMDPQYNKDALKRAEKKRRERDPTDTENGSGNVKLYPLPLYNHISREDFETITQTTPNGTTITTLVPTKNALMNAENLAKTNKNSNGTISEINGIPLSMLDQTGSVQLDESPMVSGQDATLPSFSNSNEPLPNIPRGIRSHSHPAKAQVGTSSPSGPYHQSSTSMQTPVSPITSSLRKLANPTSLFGNHRNNSNPLPKQLSQHNLNARNNGTNSGNLKNVDVDLAPLPPNPVTNPNSFPNLDIFQPPQQQQGQQITVPQRGRTSAEQIPHDSSKLQLTQLSDFFQQQSAGWIEGDLSKDDFFGWFDMGMEPEL